MAVKKIRPTTPGRRQLQFVDYSGITKKRPEKRLTSFIKNAAGRDGSGKIAARHRGGGHKRLYRHIDFSRLDKKGVPGTVAAIEYDPNRTAFIALVNYADGDKRYILAEEQMQVGDAVLCDDKLKVRKGNRMQLINIPEGFEIYNVELKAGKGGQMARGAGGSVKLASLEGKYAQIILPSGEARYVPKNCFATVGKVGNIDHTNKKLGKAGRSRWLRKRPQVRGKAMNPVDHPHGGGEGGASVGMKHPKTPWGKPALGFKTRKRKYTDKMIIRKKQK